MTKPFTLIAATIFGLMALLHVYRLFVGIPITIGTAVIPLKLSWVALIVTGGMSYGLFREARR